MLNKLLLLSGNDVPFIGAQTSIHQPKIKQIAFLGQQAFYIGSNFLCFSKDNLSQQDKTNLINQTDFDILMSIMNSKVDALKYNLASAELVLSLLFPNYDLVKMPNMLLLNKVKEDGTKEQIRINNDNYDQFKSILKQIFCLDVASGSNYNPANKRAEQIAKKLQERQKLLSQKSGEDNKQINILCRYVSILALGNHHTIPQLMEYTVYQLFNEFKRFEKKYSYDVWFQAKLAGAENLEDVDNWLSDEEKMPQATPRSGRIEF